MTVKPRTEMTGFEKEYVKKHREMWPVYRENFHKNLDRMEVSRRTVSVEELEQLMVAIVGMEGIIEIDPPPPDGMVECVERAAALWKKIAVMAGCSAEDAEQAFIGAKQDTLEKVHALVAGAAVQGLN